MRGPIEQIIDYRAVKKDKPTFSQELSESNLKETIQTENVGILLAASGTIMTAINSAMLVEPIYVETEQPVNNFFAQETIETAVVFGMKAPFVFTTLLAASVAVEGANLWRRARKHHKELLDLNKV